MKLRNIEWTPTEGKLMVRQFEEEAETEGGIKLPDKSRGMTCAGEVLKVPGLSDSFAVGDLVYFNSFAAIPVVGKETENLVVLAMTDVLMRGISNDPK